MTATTNAKATVTTQQKLVGKMTPKSSECLSQSERVLTAADRLGRVIEDGCDPRLTASTPISFNAAGDPQVRIPHAGSLSGDEPTAGPSHPRGAPSAN
jgi:hypothetical protein